MLLCVLILHFHQDVDRADNERAASRALKSITSAEAEFRANDRDGNQVNDYWTGDVAGLYYTRPNTSQVGPEIRLIERTIAEADAAPLKPLVPVPIPYHGYLFRALEVDDEPEPATGERSPKKETSGSPPPGKVRHRSKFGFVAYPAEYPKTGKYYYFVNENNCIGRDVGDGKDVVNWLDPSGPTLRRPNGAPTPVKVVADAQKGLTRTTVTAHLLERHQPNQNLVWCATMQFAWNALEKTLGFPLELQGSPPMAVAMNRKLLGIEVADPEKYVIFSGKRNSQVLEQIKTEMRKRFPRAELPPLDWQPDDTAMAFAYLFANLPFETPLFRHQKGISFRGEHVSAFGLWDAHSQKPLREQLREVTVCEFASDSDFVVQLHSTAPGERIIVARVTPGETLLDTVQSVMKRSLKQTDGLVESDDLIIPCVNFDLTRTYPEVEGPRFRFVHGGEQFIRTAYQRTQFRLDELGARLESVATAWSMLNGDPPKGRKMICDGPFLILLARVGAPLPYFAFWVENEELLVR
jgi:hypothetical protein